MKIKISKKKKIYAFTKVYDVLIDLYKNKQYPFNVAIRPQDPEYLPKNLELKSLQHALYLFYACLYMRGRIKSHQAFERLKILYEKHPEVFDPAEVQAQRYFYYEELPNYLKAVGLGVDARRTAAGWVHNSVEIFHFWNGDPRNIFNCINDTNRKTPEAYELICSKIIRPPQKKGEEQNRRGFYGFRFKMVSMYCYFLSDAGIIPSFLFPSPVDFHVLRIHIMLNIIYAKGLGTTGLPTEKFLLPVRELTSNYCSERNIDPVALADVLWFYSRDVCSFNPNSTRYKFIGKKKGRNTEILIENYVNWTKSNIYKYLEGCGNCPLLLMCYYYLSSTEYYSKGILRRVKHLRPSQDALFSIPKRIKKIKPVLTKKIRINKTIPLQKSSLFDNQN